MTYYRRVSKNTANNMVARAYAQEKLNLALVDQKIKLYMTEKGEDCAELMTGLGMTLAVVGLAAETDPAIGPDDTLVRVLRGGLSACQQLLNSSGHDPLHNIAISQALDAAEKLNTRVKARYINQAFISLTRKPVIT